MLVSTAEIHFDHIPNCTNIVALLRTLAQGTVDARNPKPLVLSTTGCKGNRVRPRIHGTLGLKPHKEDSPLNAPSALACRAHDAIHIFDNVYIIAPGLLRLTNFYGRFSSLYARGAGRSLGHPHSHSRAS